MERLGIEKTKQEVEKSDIVIILDEKDPFEFAKRLKNIDKKPCLYVTSKSELIKNRDLNKKSIALSSLKNTGIDSLLTALLTEALGGFIPENSYITSVRQAVLLKKSLILVSKASEGLGKIDMVQLSSLLRSSIDEMEDVLGKTNNEEVLNKIFGSFCVGK